MINKLILFDVDDTIIDHSTSKSTIPKETITAIKGLKEKGYHVGIASGRSNSHIKHIMEILDLNISVSFGGHVVTIENKEIYKKYLDIDETNRLIKQLYKTIYPVVCINQDHIYIKDLTGRVKKEMYKKENTIEGEEHVLEITPIDKLDLEKREYLSMMIFTPKVKKQASYKKLDFSPWGKLGYEVYSKGISKYSGIQVLAKALNISMDNVYAFGDNYNDIHMLKHVKNSVAVGNGVKEVKEVASYVSPTITEGGILTACIDLGLLEGGYE